MSVLQYPPVDCVRQLLREDQGHLFWKERPVEMFPNVRLCRSWNGKCASKEAGWLFRDPNGDLRWGIQITHLKIKCHRHVIVWAMHHGEWRLGIDHKNRNTLDDRIENLRACTQSQNQANTKRRSDNTSGFKGAIWDKSRSLWASRIQFQKKTIHLGRFKTAEEAHAAYMEAARRLFGEFAHDGT